MTSKERIMRALEHKEADRVPILDSPWAGTIARWEREGMPKGMDWRDYFETDKVGTIFVDTSPRFERVVIEDAEDYFIEKSSWGATMKHFKAQDSTPEFLDFEVKTFDKWLDAKKRMTVSPDRINWKYLEENYPKWVKEGYFIHGEFWFGFDVVHSWFVGTETVLIAMHEEPEWIKDMFNHYLDMCIQHFELILDKGYKFDAINWPDDMGYKNTQFFSKEMYHELLLPVQKRAVDWAKSKGLKARLHSCGNIMPFLDDIIAIGIDCLNPLEVKAGMNPALIKEKYGDKLCLHGGINALLWTDKDAIVEEIKRLVPILKENGGYIFGSDHSIPNAVSLENMKLIMDTVKEYGKYN